MNIHTKVSEEKKIESVANSLSKNKSSANTTFQLVDNRISSTRLSNNNVSVKQLKSYQAISSFNSARTIQRFEKPVANTNVIQLAKFTPEQRRKLLAANKLRNGGFHTCTHCGFQHSKKRYATLKGRRIGDANFQIDHIIHLSRGGRNLLRNGRVLCGTCNASRGNRALVGRTGISKYRALHGKTFRKNYLRKPSQNY